MEGLRDILCDTCPRLDLRGINQLKKWLAVLLYYLALIILLPSGITGVHYHVQLSIQKISLQKLCINVHLNAGPERLLDFMLLVTGSCELPDVGAGS